MTSPEAAAGTPNRRHPTDEIARDPPPLRPPSFVRSIRFRLTVLYSTLLFALAALVLGGIYVGISRSAEAKPITARQAQLVKQGYGEQKVIGTLTVAEVSEIEENVNYQTLQTLRRYSVAMLGGLFVASLGIGWVLSGRALRPVRAIARTAEEIQATDLSRRIRLGGPGDELRYLADTIDSMLARLDDAFQAQRRLIDDASHEMRNPLAVIRANLDAVLSSPDASEEERRRAAAVVDRATTRMTGLVEDLLATARRSAPAFSDGDIDLAEVAREAGEEFGPLAAARRVTLAYELRDGLTMVGDHDALRRAIGNLLSNAVRLAPEGSRITVATGREDGETAWLWVAVADQGPGIPDADQPRVFDRFWRGETRGGPDRRTGLGLAIVRQIAEGHGGRVRLFSRVDRGSTFVLWLPTVRGTAGTPPDADPLAGPARPSPGSGLD